MEDRIKVLEETLEYERRAYEKLFNQGKADVADLIAEIKRLKKEIDKDRPKEIPTRAFMITINDEYDVPQKRWQHDCQKCKFVGSVTISRLIKNKWKEEHEDIYICPSNSSALGSIVRRRGNDGSNYGSFPLDIIGVNQRNANEGSYEWMLNQLQKDGILSYEFKWNFTERGYRCLHCKEPISPNSYEDYHKYPYCNDMCKAAEHKRHEEILNSFRTIED